MSKLKYTVKLYLTTEKRRVLLNLLGISEKTLYRKLNAQIGQSGGFEVCEMEMIASILDKNLQDLITPEAKEYYTKKMVAKYG